MERQIKHPGETKSETLRAVPRACIDESAAVEFMEKQRWGDTPACPHCGSIDVAKVIAKDGTRGKRYLWRCHDCKRQFTVRVGTILEDSRIPIRYWCHAFWRACASKKGVSALQISRECNLSYKSALFLMHRIRWAMATPKPTEQFKGTVEVDETYVGGKPRNRHAVGVKAGRGTKKVPVMAIVEREGRIRVKPVVNVTAKTLRGEMRRTIDPSARVCTDEYVSYKGAKKEYAGGHGRVLHSAGEYVNGTDHVNTCESFFALFKRGIYGTFHAVSRKHLHRYASEFEFRWTTRRLDDGARLTAAIKAGDGKRLMYRQPVKKQPPESKNVADTPGQPLLWEE